MRPCVPDDWPGFTLGYRVPGEETRYEIEVANPERSARVVIEASADGARVPVADGAARVPIVRDGRTHTVKIVLGARGGRGA